MKNAGNMVTPIMRDEDGLIAFVDNLIDNATDRAEIINANQRSNTATDTDGNLPGNTVVLNRKTRSVDIDPHK